jgi:Na+-transporting NADH:ubiquinone oxidoreductase subunit D
MIIAFFRELFGSGSIFGFKVIPDAWYISNGGFYENNGLMVLSPMALIVVGVIVWIHRYKNRDLIEQK